MAAGRDGDGPLILLTLSRSIRRFDEAHRTNPQSSGIFAFVNSRLTSGFLTAQSGTSSAISGTVVDASGAVLPNAGVSATKSTQGSVAHGSNRAATGISSFPRSIRECIRSRCGRAALQQQTSRAGCRRSGTHRYAELQSHHLRDLADGRSDCAAGPVVPWKSEYHHDARIQDHRQPAQSGAGPHVSSRNSRRAP